MNKVYFNPNTPERAGFEPIIGGNPSGLLNMNHCQYEWAVKIYKQMKALDWTPNDVNTNGEALRYQGLSDAEKRMYNLAFAQLSFDDAVQADAIQTLNIHISNKVVSACIHRVSEEEVNHSLSYAVLLQDTTGNADMVFDLYKSDPILRAKNQWISDRYVEYTKVPVMLAFIAQLVEGVVFLGGFAAIFSLGQKMTASAQMVAYISKDEINSHLPLFANIVKTILRENPEAQEYGYIMVQLLREATAIEIEWLEHISEGVLGFTEDTIKEFVQSIADERCVALGMPKVYEGGKNHLNKLLDSYTRVNAKRSNFFESKSSTYSKGLNMEEDF